MELIITFNGGSFIYHSHYIDTNGDVMAIVPKNHHIRLEGIDSFTIDSLLENHKRASLLIYDITKQKLTTNYN